MSGSNITIRDLWTSQRTKKAQEQNNSSSPRVGTP